MYYRYEAMLPDGSWTGICSVLDPSERRRFNRLVREPKWYSVGNNAGRKSTCWLTEEGFAKYGTGIAALIAEHRERVETPPLRFRTAETLGNIVVRGKIQVINLEE